MAVNVSGGALEFDALINESQFGAAIRRIEGQLQGLTTTAEKEAAAIDNLVKKTVQGISAYATFAAGTNFVSDIIKVRGEFQQLEVAFTTMLGSKQKADQLLAQVTEFAATTPFELKDVAAATKQLLAFGISADKIESTLRALGDVSAGIGAPLGDIAYLFGTIKTQGVALTQDVRQFAQRGIPIYEELAKILGVTNEEVGNFITAGKVGFPEIEKVFQNLTAEGSKFGGLMEAQSKTLVGQISNLRDAFDQMLNEIGRSGEGIFADAISGVKFLVDNYKDVIKILEVLVITYGSYRAAIVATAAVQSVATALTKGYTVAELLRYQAMVLSDKAMKILNATLLKNPAAFVIAGIASIVAALTLFGKKATDVKTKAELLASAQEKIGESMADQESKIRPYVDALNTANVSEQTRLEVYNKLKAIDPSIVAGLDAKTISYQALTANVNKYLDSLRKQYALEANKDAIRASIEQEEAIRKKAQARQKEADEKLAKLQKQLDAVNKSDNPAFKNANKGLAAEIENLKKFSLDAVAEINQELVQQQKVTQELGTVQVKASSDEAKAHVRNLGDIEAEIRALKEKQSNVSENNRQFQEYQQKINALEEEKKRITGASKAELKSYQAEENKALALLEKRKDLLEEIADRVKAAQLGSRTKEQTELDKINEKYDKIIDNIVEYNKKVDEFNKKNPRQPVNKIGQVDIAKLEKARSLDLTNTSLKEDAERYKKSLEERQRLFERFEDLKKKVGINKANELLAAQTQGYESYLQFLQSESKKLLPKISLGIANVGEVAKFKAIIDEINKYNEEKRKEDIDNQAKAFVDLLSSTQTYNEKKSEINRKYDQLEKTLRANSTIAEAEEKARLLEAARKEELEQLDNDLLRQSDLYKKLNQDILGFTRERIKGEIELLKKKLKTDTSLTPQMKADIQNTIDQYKGLLEETNQVARDFSKAASKLSQISSIFADLGNAVEGLNDGLADTLNTLAQITEVAGSAASAVAQIASGDIVGGVASGIKAIVGLFSIGRQARESRRRAQAEIQAFNDKVIAGEMELTAIIRERERDQLKLVTLRLDALQKEKELLQQQKQAVADQYNSILAQLQQETFVADEVTKKYGGVFGIGRKTKVVQIQQTLEGKSFSDLEKLFAEGKLQGRAKQLFEQLQKIKDEGADIEALLIANQEAAREIFTGTTADGIVDSIAEGFANGLHSAGDFADTFQDLMRKAMINALKFKYLEGPLQDFFKEFASAAESNNELTSSEIDQLNALFNSIISTADQQFQQLQQISGLNLTGGSSQANTLTGAIKGMTETQADLLAGQFGGLRITALEQLVTAKISLETLNAIQVNTGITVIRMTSLLAKFDSYETGAKRLKVDVQ